MTPPLAEGPLYARREPGWTARPNQHPHRDGDRDCFGHVLTPPSTTGLATGRHGPEGRRTGGQPRRRAETAGAV